jgi:hypothetical protein
MSVAAEDEDHSLARSLLHEPVASNDAPDRRWAYPTWAMALVSLFVAYHAATLLVHNLPGGGFSRGLHTFFNKYLKGSEYFRVTGLAQSWGMFAPNPHRTNSFMRVLVEGQDGEVWDLAHDIYGRRRYPYLFYDRMGKINRRIVEARGYQRHYAAWVCREWEREHGGEALRGVRFVRMWNRIPPPEKVYRFMYYDPMDLYLHVVDEDSFECATLQHGQLPNEQRERLGLEPRPDEEIRDIVLRTWWDREESQRRAREQGEREEETP